MKNQDNIRSVEIQSFCLALLPERNAKPSFFIDFTGTLCAEYNEEEIFCWDAKEGEWFSKEFAIKKQGL